MMPKIPMKMTTVIMLMMQKQLQSWLKCSCIHFALPEKFSPTNPDWLLQLTFQIMISCFLISDRNILSLEKNLKKYFLFLFFISFFFFYIRAQVIKIFKQLSLDFILICLHRPSINLMVASSNWNLVYQTTRLGCPLSFDTLMFE